MGTTWKDPAGKEHALQLTVGHCLTLRGSNADVTGNPVPVLLGLKDPGVSLRVLASMLKETEESFSDAIDRLAVGMTGEHFSELQTRLEEVIVDFFRSDASFSEFLEEVIQINSRTRLEAQEKGLEEMEKDIRRAMDLTPEKETDPTGGKSSLSPPESPDSTPDLSPSETSTPPQEERSELSGKPTPRSSPPSPTRTPTEIGT